MRKTFASAAAVGVVAAAFSVVVVPTTGCPQETPVQVWVDGFQPENVRFEVEALGAQTAAQLSAIKGRPDVDGALLLPPGSCPGPCQATILSIFVNNRGAHKEPPPVVRLASPPGMERRLPIAFSGADIDPGRVGRIRWLVEMHPAEKDLTVTLSSSVRLDVQGPKPLPAPTVDPLAVSPR